MVYPIMGIVNMLSLLPLSRSQNPDRSEELKHSELRVQGVEITMSGAMSIKNIPNHD